MTIQGPIQHCTYMASVQGNDPDHSMNHTHAVRYYFRAQYSYDPHYQSPNEEGLEEELAFSEGDVITVSCKSYIVTEVMAD